jgi:osmotically inducible protein OsmC
MLYAMRAYTRDSIEIAKFPTKKLGFSDKMNFASASILRTLTEAKPPFEETAMSIVKKASAHWEGDLKTGLGSISTETGVLREAPYGFKARFEGGKGTNPEELIGAAHAGCFSMAFSMILGDAGLKADSIDTQAEVTLDQVEGGFAITAVHLILKAKIPGASQAQFDELSKKAKEGCPVSKVLNAKISLDATLVS